MRRIPQYLIVVACSAFIGTRLWAEDKAAVALSINEFTRMALTGSLRSKDAEDTFTSGRWGWLATHRNLTWPTLSTSLSHEKDFSDTDTGLQTNTRSDTAQLALKQPLLWTGTSLFLNSNWNRQRSDFDTLGLTTETLTRQLPAWEVGFTQPLFVFVGNPNLRARRSADLQFQNNEEQYLGQRLSIEFDARSSYYDLLLQAETAEVQRKKFESAKLVNEATRALVNAGKLAEVELVRADIQSKEDQRNIQNAENTLEKEMNTAKDLISLPPEQTMALTSQLVYVPFQTPLETIYNAALQYNPDLQVAKHQIELAEIDLRQTRETDRPQLTTSGSYGITRDRSNPDLPLDPYQWTVKVGMDWFLFDATQTQLQTRQKEIAVNTAKRAYENQLRQLKISVENAYLEIKRTEDQISDFEPQKESAAQNVRAMRLQYKNGLTRLTDVFDAENQLRDLELEYLGLLVSFNKARDGLKVIVGADLDMMSKGQQ